MKGMQSHYEYQHKLTMRPAKIIKIFGGKTLLYEKLKTIAKKQKESKENSLKCKIEYRNEKQMN